MRCDLPEPGIPSTMTNAWLFSVAQRDISCRRPSSPRSARWRGVRKYVMLRSGICVARNVEWSTDAASLLITWSIRSFSQHCIRVNVSACIGLCSYQYNMGDLLMRVALCWVEVPVLLCFGLLFQAN